MHLRKLLFLCSALLLSASPMTSPPELRGQAPGGELKFTISLNNRGYTANQPVTLQMKLENVSNHSIVVNTRFLVNIAGGPHEVVLQVLDPDKKTLHFLPLIRASFQSDEYIALAPGKSVTDAHNIAHDFVFTQRGEYSVRAYYENANDAPAAMKLAPAWKGTLESNKVQFAIR